jgi:hypothetical protein
MDIRELYISTRTYNRLRKMEIGTLDQIARTTPKEFLRTKGFGKKCLHEIGETLQEFYSSLDPAELARLANVVELWRPFFSHPERVPEVPYDPSPRVLDQSESNGSPATAKPVERFDLRHNLQAQLHVEDLAISTRARNVLREAGVRTLNNLAQISPEALYKSENCGRRTIRELANLLRGYFDSLPPYAHEFYRATRLSWVKQARRGVNEIDQISDHIPHVEKYSVAQLLEISFAKLGARSAAILSRRVGLSEGQTRKTLEATGREFRLTRERVRQIVEAGLKLILRNVKTFRPDVYQDIRAFVRLRGVASLDELISEVSNLGTSALFDSKACIRVLMFANRHDIHPLDSRGNIWGSKEITPEFHRQVLRSARLVLNGIPMKCEQVSVEVAKSLGQLDDKQIKTIHKMLLNSPRPFTVELSGEDEMLCPPLQNSQDRRRAFIYAYIKEQGVPIQFQEVFSAMQDSEPELIPDSPSRKSAISTITSSLDRDERFAWAGTSTWGLREWGYVSRGRTVSSAILEILRVSDVPLSAAQIKKQLSQLYRVSSAGVFAALKSCEGKTIEKNPQGLWRLI